VSGLAYRECLVRVLHSDSMSQCYCPVSTSNRIVKPLSRELGVAKFSREVALFNFLVNSR